MFSFERIIQYLLCLLVFLLPLQTRWIIVPGELNGYFEYGTISLYLTDILLVFVFVMFFLCQTGQNIRDDTDIIWILVGIFEFFVFVSIFFAPETKLATYAYVRFLFGLTLFFLVLNSLFDFKKLLISFLVGSFIEAMLGIWQFLFQTSFESKWLGIASHFAWALGDSVVETTTSRWLRAYGSLDHPNIFGGLMAVSILFLFFFIKRRNSIFYIVLSIYWTALIFSFSRTAWLGVLAGLFFYFLFSIYKRECRSFLIKPLLSIFVLTAILGFVYSDLFFTRLNNQNRLEIQSNRERISLLEEAKHLMKKHIIFGAGVGNYSTAVFKEIDNSRPSYTYQPVHNVFFLIGVELGILGLISFLIFLFYLAHLLVQKHNFDALSILLSILIMMMFDHWWWSLHFGVLLFWFVLGILFINAHKKQSI